MNYIIQPTSNDIVHSGRPWKKHKYIKKIGNRYIYATTSAKYRMMYGHGIKTPERQKVHPYSVKGGVKAGAALGAGYGAWMGSRRKFLKRTVRGGIIGGGVAIAKNASAQHEANKEYRKEKRQLNRELRKAKSSSFTDAIKAMGRRIIEKLTGRSKKNK